MATERIEKSDGKTSGMSIEDFNARIGDRIVIDAASIGNTDTGAHDDARGNRADNDNFGKRNIDGSIPKKRGRKPGSSAGKKSSTSIDSSGIEKILFSAHLMMASAFSVPEMMLDNSEAKEIAVAVAKVAEHYNIEASSEVIAWTNLIVVLLVAYGTRATAIISRKRKERKPSEKVVKAPVNNADIKNPPIDLNDNAWLNHASSAG